VETAQPIDGRRRFKGTLLGLENGAVKLRLDDGTEAHLPLSAVTKAKLELTDALLDEYRRAQDGAAETRTH
jgi:ribosome maturation factor RimP